MSTTGAEELSHEAAQAKTPGSRARASRSRSRQDSPTGPRSSPSCAPPSPTESGRQEAQAALPALEACGPARSTRCVGLRFWARRRRAWHR